MEQLVKKIDEELQKEKEQLEDATVATDLRSLIILCREAGSKNGAVKLMKQHNKFLDSLLSFMQNAIRADEIQRFEKTLSESMVLYCDLFEDCTDKRLLSKLSKDPSKFMPVLDVLLSIEAPCDEMRMLILKLCAYAEKEFKLKRHVIAEAEKHFGKIAESVEDHSVKVITDYWDVFYICDQRANYAKVLQKNRFLEKLEEFWDEKEQKPHESWTAADAGPSKYRQYLEKYRDVRPDELLDDIARILQNATTSEEFVKFCLGDTNRGYLLRDILERSEELRREKAQERIMISICNILENQPIDPDCFNRKEFEMYKKFREGLTPIEARKREENDIAPEQITALFQRIIERSSSKAVSSAAIECMSFFSGDIDQTKLKTQLESFVDETERFINTYPKGEREGFKEGTDTYTTSINYISTLSRLMRFEVVSEYMQSKNKLLDGILQHLGVDLKVKNTIEILNIVEELTFSRGGAKLIEEKKKFDEAVKIIANNGKKKEIASDFKVLRKHDNKDIRSKCKGIQLNIQLLNNSEAVAEQQQGTIPREKCESGKTAMSKKHYDLMISYNWNSKKDVLELTKALRQAGYKVWLDEDEMYGDIIDRMVEGVERSDLVVAAISQCYEQSKNCRREAMYADKLSKRMLYVKAEPSYEPKCWLAFIMENKLYIVLKDPEHGIPLEHGIPEVENGVKEMLQKTGDEDTSNPK